MLGAGGTQTTSTTLLETSDKRPYHIDVENPAPGVRAGQLHLQTSDAKYLYDFDKGEFAGVSGRLARTVASDPDVALAIAKGQIYLNVK
jgi:hypothetical protein